MSKIFDTDYRSSTKDFIIYKLILFFADFYSVQIYIKQILKNDLFFNLLFNMQELLAEIQEAFVFQCPICCSRVDEGDHLPLMMCHKQHIYCKSCIEEQFSNQDSKLKKLYAVCPQCRTEVARENIKEFRVFRKMFKIYNKIKSHIEEELLYK